MSYWRNDAVQDWKEIECLCIGTGRFLRSVLVPVLAQRVGPTATALVQPRGRAFLEFMKQQQEEQHGNTIGSYPVDTVLQDSVQRDYVSIGAAFSWGNEQDRQVFFEECLPKFQGLQLIAVGITEAGLASPDTSAMQQFFVLIQTLALLHQRQEWKFPNNNNRKIVVINTDNLPQNGSLLRQHVLTLANRLTAENEPSKQLMIHEFLEQHMVFLDSMVDRIVSETPHSNGLIPRAEPTPLKAMVLLDPHHDLPQWFVSTKHTENNTKDPLGVVVRHERHQLEADVALKLCIANATHTTVAHIMALAGLLNTTALATITPNNKSQNATIMLMNFMDALVQHQIQPAAMHGLQISQPDVAAVWHDWRQRVTHPTFGASTFFITQNGAAKGGIRIGPTARRIIEQQQTPNTNHSSSPPPPLQISVAFAMAVLLRWLTPSSTAPPEQEIIYQGRLATTTLPEDNDSNNTSPQSTVTYADGLRYNFPEGRYEFKCDCPVERADKHNNNNQSSVSIATWLAELGQGTPQPHACLAAVRAYLVAPTGGNLQAVAATNAFDEFAMATSVLYARMNAGDHPMDMLQEMDQCQGAFTKGWETPCHVVTDGPLTSIANGRPLHYQALSIPDDSKLLTKPVSVEEMESVVTSEVASVKVIDVHTHLLPPQHGPLCLWGIDELLCYHYLVAEFFITAPASLTPEKFYALPKKEQANKIWQALFVERSPISEACRGVVTTLVKLGLEQAVQARDLNAIRAFYQSYQERGMEGAVDFSNLVFDIAGVDYNIMTNIPFDSMEAQYWKGPHQTDYDKVHFRSAVRVDPFLSGDQEAIDFALRSGGYDVSLEGARQFLRDWCDQMKPEYIMGSTPHNFQFGTSESLANTKRNNNVNEATFTEPGAFADVAKAEMGSTQCDEAQDDMPSVINEHSDFLSEVLMKVCEERDLPLALKIGAHRAVNPELKQAGDGVVAFADSGVLSRLCARFPKVRFLATFLSRNNQHEACVIASKFRNLHIYGCWWYCNNPSIIRELTSMRIEMLGTAFTCQHSDARILDQLIYKWAHSRSVVASVLSAEYKKLADSGWRMTRAEIRRDVKRLFGGSYEEFMAKSLL